MLNIEFQLGGSFFILGKSFLSHTYTTFFLDRKEIWISQPSESKYKKLILEKKPVVAHESAKKKVHKGKIAHNGRYIIWNKGLFNRLKAMADKQHASSGLMILKLSLGLFVFLGLV